MIDAQGILPDVGGLAALVWQGVRNEAASSHIAGI